jgi:hypothetical protein
MAAKRVNKETQALLSEAGKHKTPPKQSWLTKLPAEQRQSIIEAYRALPETGSTITGLVRAIVKRYRVTAAESSIRETLRALDRE